MAKVWYNGDIVISQGGNMNAKAPGNRPRAFCITKEIRRMVLSAVVKMDKIKEYKLIFLTITFPFDATEREAAELFVSLLDNMKKTYKLKYYVWTKELTKAGRLHYHLLCDIPFFDIRRCQKTWNTIIKNMYPHIICTNNSLRLPDRNKWRRVVVDSAKVARYISKYITKPNSKNPLLFHRRAYQISKNLFPLYYYVPTIDVVDWLREGRLKKGFVNKYSQILFTNDLEFVCGHGELN